MENITEWVTRVTDGESWRTIAARLNTTHPTIQRRLKNDTASAVVEIATEYGANPVEGLLFAGSITQSHIDAFTRAAGIEAYDDLELAEEMVKRIQERQDSPLATVTEFPVGRSNVHDGTVRDFDYPAGTYAADSSPDEDALREEEGSDPVD